MSVLVDIIIGAISEANAVSQLFIRQSMMNIELRYNGQVWLTRDLAPVSQRIRNQLQNLLFALRTMIRTQPDNLYRDQSIVLSLCEQNNLIGWQSGHVVFSYGINVTDVNWVDPVTIHVQSFIPAFQLAYHAACG